jgi:hypothetical protein
MGWNQGYTIFEATVIGAYNLGRLDADLLSVLMEPYRNTDIDEGGSRSLKTNDGLSVEEVIVSVMKPSVWASYLYLKEHDDLDAYDDAFHEAFHDITSKRFGWG